MKTNSVRFRLTIWYSLAFFLATAVIFTSFYLVTKQALFTQTDTIITSHAQKIVDIITKKETDMHQMMARQSFIQDLSDPGMVVILMDNGGNIVGSTFTINLGDKVISELYQSAITADKAIFLNETLSTTNLRFIAKPIHQNNMLSGVLLVGHPIDVIEKSLTSLLIMLGVVFVIFMIPTIIGGYLFAQGAMKPITDISDKLKKISTENLDERVDIPKTNDEIKELTITFNNLFDRLSAAFKRERQFIGDLAHELKTPLTTQRSNIEVILSKHRSKEEYIQALLESLQDNKRITTTLKNILDLAWSQADEIEIHTKYFNLSELLEELNEIAVQMALPKKITVEGKIEQNIKVKGRRDKISHALVNIIDNAIKYTPTKGMVSLTLYTTSKDALVQVKDNGIGISKSDLPHIFDRFYRGSRTDRTFGAGLGLAIARAIITAQHGRVTVLSKIGQGTTVTIHIPDR